MIQRYAVTLYHDEPGEANANTRGAGLYQSVDAAVRAARLLLSDYWQTATVDAGEYDPGQLGIRPPHFTLDYDIPSLYAIWRAVT